MTTPRNTTGNTFDASLGIGQSGPRPLRCLALHGHLGASYHPSRLQSVAYEAHGAGQLTVVDEIGVAQGIPESYVPSIAASLRFHEP